jgi:hypothetical protein
MTDCSTKPPISMVTNDKFEIIKYLEERVEVINTVNNLINKWSLKPDEILDVMRVDEHFSIENEDVYRNEFSEEALRYSIKVHDLLELDYKCKKCIVRASCCRYSNVENLSMSGGCNGIIKLLDAPILIQIEDYYIQKSIGNDA